MGHPVDGKRAIALLGGAAIQVDGVPLGGRAAHRHPLAILALLVANAGRPITRDKLIALLWPERDADSARNLLKVNLHELRKELGEGAIRSTGDQLSIDSAEISCDVTDFLNAIARGDHACAAACYTGPFLDGFYLKDAAEFERWAESERARLAQLYAQTLEQLAATAQSSGDHDAVVRWRRAQANLDPYHPEVAQRLVEALATSGDHAGAIKVAESFATRRRDDLGISDDGGLITLARTLTTVYTPSSPPRALERASDPVVDVPAVAPRANRVRTAIGVFAVVGIAIIAAGSTILRRNASGPEIRPVAVKPFHVVGVDGALGEQEASLLATRLAMEPSAELNGRLVTGEIVGSRDSLVVSATIAGARDGSPMATARTAAAAGTSLAGLTDRLAVELIARALGEPPDRIAGITSRPFVAARKYLSAQSAYRSGRYAVAESLYAQALAADTTFGAAGLGLAMANSWTSINEHYGIGRDAAMSHLSSMGERDRLFALAFFGPDPALGAPHPAPEYLHRWEDLVEKYPDWTEAWYQLGDRYFHYGGLSGLADSEDRARHAFERALAQDSLFAAPLHHLVELYASHGDKTSLQKTGDRYFALNPSVGRDRSAIGWEVATALGDSGWLRRVRANFDGMPREELTRIGWVTDANGWPRVDAERAESIANQKAGTVSEHERALISKLSLDLNGNRPAAVRADAAGLGAQFPDRPIGALWDLYVATFGTPDSVLANNAVARLAPFVRGGSTTDHVRRDQHHLASCMVGYWMAMRNDAGARRTLDRLKTDLRGEDNNFAKRNGDVCAAMLAATIETNAHAPDAKLAVARLDTVLLEQRVPPHAILEAGTLVSARLHAALGDTAAALVAARRREHLTGDPIFLASELEAEARYATALGDKEGAARAMTHLAALRK